MARSVLVTVRWVKKVPSKATGAVDTPSGSSSKPREAARRRDATLERRAVIQGDGVAPVEA